MGKDLRTYLAELTAARPKDLMVVDDETDPRFGLTSMVERLEAEGRNEALLFTRVRGSSIPCLINLGASFSRLALALGKQSVRECIEDLATRENQPIPPREVRREQAPVKEVVMTGDQVNLDLLPILVHNEFDGGYYVDAGPMILRERGTGRYNVGLYRHQKHSPRRLGIMINPANHGNYVRAEYEDHNEPTQAAIVIGHHPAWLLAAVTKQPAVGGEMEITGAFLGEPLDVIRGETVDMMVPARAEIVIEGVVPPHQRHQEGTFGEWPRYYYKEGPMPFLDVTAITMRRRPIYQSIFNAHNEHTVIGALPRIGSLLRRVRGAVPSVTGVNLPISGAGRSHCYITIKKRAEGEAKQAAMAAMVTDPNIKFVVVVDDDVDVFNEQQVLWALAMRFQADRGLAIIPHALGSHLVPTAYGWDRLTKGPMETKLIFDATKPLPPFEFPKEAKAPADLTAAADLRRLRPFTDADAAAFLEQMAARVGQGRDR
ncbi:MAG: UbiD family decarboxylase [Armatimonadota bacterium]